MALNHDEAVGSGPARVADDKSIFSTYLCTEPFGRVQLASESGSASLERLLETLQMSTDYFSKQSQLRTVERLRMEMAWLNIENAEWNAGLSFLLPLWRGLSWRREGWWSLVAEVDWALRDCALYARDVELLISVEWELLCSCRYPFL